MQPFSWARVLLAGLVAGIVINSLAYLFAIAYFLDGSNFAKPLADVIAALEQPLITPTNFIVLQQVWGFITGLLTMWLCARSQATQRPAFPWAAILIAWACACALPYALLWADKVRMPLVALIFGLFEIAMGAVLGSWIYREAEAASQQATAGTAIE